MSRSSKGTTHTYDTAERILLETWSLIRDEGDAQVGHRHITDCDGFVRAP